MRDPAARDAGLLLRRVGCAVFAVGIGPIGAEGLQRVGEGVPLGGGGEGSLCQMGDLGPQLVALAKESRRGSDQAGVGGGLRNVLAVFLPLPPDAGDLSSVGGVDRAAAFLDRGNRDRSSSPRSRREAPACLCRLLYRPGPRGGEHTSDLHSRYANN